MRSHHWTCELIRCLVVASAIGNLTLLPSMAAVDAPRTFQSPEDATRELIRVVKAGRLEELIALFGRDGQELADRSDPATGRKNREVFTAAAGERWRLVDQGSSRKTLVIGNEGRPFPVSLVHYGTAWRFDAAAELEEVIARRIGR